MDVETNSVELTAPELAAAWAALPDAADVGDRAEVFLGLPRFLAAEEYLQLGRGLLMARAHRGSAELAFAQIERAVLTAKSATTIMSLHRDGSMHLNRLIFVADDTFAVWTTVAAGFRVEVGTLTRLGSALEECMENLHAGDRVFLSSEYVGRSSAGIAWAGGQSRILSADSWADAGALDIAHVPDWFYGCGYLMATT